MKTLFTSKHFRKYYLPFENEKQGRICLKLFTAVLLLIVLGVSNTYAQAPVISYASPQSYIVNRPISPLSPTNTGGAVVPSIITLPGTYQEPRGLAVDASGNMYEADNNTNLVQELTAGASSPITIGSGFSSPMGVAVDAAGNVYVADFNNHAIKMIPAGNGTVSTIFTGTGSIYGIALDGHGFIYFSDFTNSKVEKIPVGGGTALIVGTGFNTPTGVAVDASGNVYIADRGNNAIKKILASNGSTVVVGSAGGNPNGVAVDASGNVYFADGDLDNIVEIPVGGGSNIAIASGLLGPLSVCFDNNDNIFMGDNGHSLVKKLSLAPYGFSVSPALPAGLVIDSKTGVISGTPTVLKAATNYTVTALNSSGSGTATVNIAVVLPPAPNISYKGPQGYLVGKTITPLAPTNSGGAVTSSYTISPVLSPGLHFNDTTGVISGTPLNKKVTITYTITASNAGGTSSATVNISVNAGAAPSISYSSPQSYLLGVAITPVTPVNTGGPIPSIAPITLAGSFNTPSGIAADANGNVYIAETAANDVKEILSGGNGGVITLGSGFSGPTGIAVDVSGNVYVVDAGNSAIKKIPAGNGTVVTILSSVKCYGIALNGKGSFYATDVTNGRVLKATVAGVLQTPIGSGLKSPRGIALDTAGNVYVADDGNNALKEILASNGTTVTLSKGDGAPTGIAVDQAGNVYFADSHVAYLTEIPAGGGAHIAIGSALGAPSVVTLDSQGHIFCTVASDPVSVKEISLSQYIITPALPAGLSFDPATGTISGTPSATSPATNYSVNVRNTAGSSTATINITVSKGPVPTLSYSSPPTYSVGAAISPLTPSSSGVGAYPSGVDTKIDSGLNRVYGMAIDGAGNIYMAEEGANQIREIPAAGGPDIILGSGFNAPFGVAVDASGNVFVADYGNNAVKKIPAGNGPVVTIASGLGGPSGVALNAAGDIFVTDLGNNQVEKIPAGSSTPVVFRSGIGGPFGVAIDPAGNLFVTSSSQTGLIREISGSTGADINSFTARSNPNVIAVDAGDRIYYTNQIGKLSEIIAPTGKNTTDYSIGPATYTGVAIKLSDPSLIYVAAYGGSVIYKRQITGGYTITPALPAGLAYSPSTGVISGTPTAVSPATTYTITAYNIDGAGTTTVSIAVTSDVHLSALKISAGVLSPVFATGTTSYTASVGNGVNSLTLTPTAVDTRSTIKVNGTTVTSGSASGPIALSVGSNTISTVVTASDGVTTKTYTLNVTRAPSNNANLSTLGPSITPLSPTFAAGTTSYTLSVAYHVSTMTVKPVTSDSNATIKVNGTPLASGTTSAPIPLAEGTTTAINVVVTAQDGTTTKTYTLTVTRGPSTNASLASMNPSITPLSPTFTPATTSYTLSVANSKTSMTVRPISSDVNATITVNGTANPSGTTSAPIALAVGSNTISVVVTAQDGTTTRTYTITVTRAAGPIANFDDAISVTKPTETATLAEDGLLVHQGISPNGDGLNDFLQIDNISQYPDNKLTIMNRNGQMIYEAKNYDNSTKAFDGHSNKNGQMQLPGTYFYQLDYTVKGVVKHKTGFIVLKY